MNTEILRQEVNRFHITTSNGVEFWAPYLRNDDYTENPNVPRGLGKSSAEEIKKSADYVSSLYPSATGEEIRMKLIDGSLPEKFMNYKGIDCSGFVYWVMSAAYTKALGKELIDDLSVPKDHVLNGANNFEEWRSAYILSDEEAEKLPQDVPMRWVVETFKRHPQNLCRVNGLISHYSSTPIEPSDVQVGDLLNIVSAKSSIPHVAIILDKQPGKLVLVHSARSNPGETGGILIETVDYDGDRIATEDMSSPPDSSAVFRLKSLD